MNGEDEPDRLDRFRQGLTGQLPKESWRARLGHTLDRWSRPSRIPVREKALLALAAMLIVSVLIASIYLLTSNAISDGGRNQVVAGRPQATPTATRAPSPTPTALATGVPQHPTAQPTDRQDCEAIRGTEYNSDAERAFFQQHCVAPAQLRPTATSAPAQPTASPPSGGFTAGNAIYLGVYWITHDAPQAYTTDAGACNAIEIGSHWVVTCNASLAGCQGSVCQTTLSVCVFAAPVQVRPADQC